jgi:tellurite resistance protein TerC
MRCTQGETIAVSHRDALALLFFPWAVLRGILQRTLMLWIWLGFILFVLLLLALDLGVFHRTAHVVTVKEALGWSALWITLGVGFSVFVYFGYENHWLGLGSAIDPIDGAINHGASASIKYLTGYVVEKSLSIDNIFVIAMLFGFFAVPPLYQHRVLFWGILGALVMRGAMIGIGAQLIARFHWILYVFGGFLILTAIKMLLMKTDHADPGKNWIVRLTRRLVPVTQQFHGQHFFVRAGSAASHESPTPADAEVTDSAVDSAKPGTWMITPLMLALIMVEFTDLIFAVDSIPAIFAITGDPFLVFTSNVFAILGLRSLYFALAGMMDKFRYLKVSLALVLGLVGIKMLAVDFFKSLLGGNYNFYLLGGVLLILFTGVGASLLWPGQGSSVQKRSQRGL